MQSHRRRSRPFSRLTLSLSTAGLLASCSLEPTTPAPPLENGPPVSAAAFEVQAGGGRWETKAPIPNGRVHLAAGVIRNARGQTIFYAIGGENLRGDATTNLVQAYNSVTNVWSNRARLPEDRVFPNGTGVIKGQLYLTGGYDGATPTSDLGFTRRTLYVYDPGTNTWARKKALPMSSAAGVSGVINGQLYVLTGTQYECQDCPTRDTRKLFRYNPVTDTWKELASCPNLHMGGLGGVIDGKLYVAGGGKSRGSFVSRNLDVYDPATNFWTSKASLPTDREPGAAGSVAGNKLFVTGGGSSAVEAYDPATNTWSRLADAPDPARWGQAAGTVKNAKGEEGMLVVGALDLDFGPGETLLYTPPELPKIAFTSHRDGNSEIYLMRADGSRQQNLTRSPGDDFGQAWSPNGSKIAFQSSRDGNPEVYVMNANGSSPRNLTHHPGMDAAPAWSPDGRKIAFHSSRDGNFEIYRMNADGTGLVRLTNDPGFDFNPFWSPDGTKVLFERSPGTPDSHPDVYVMNANGTGQTNLTNDPAEDTRARWSPDGRKIVFMAGRDGNLEIYVMNADGSAQTNVSHSAGNDQAPDWSPDGSRIAFERDGEIYVMRANGSDQIRLTNNSVNDGIPTWSHDGKLIAFTSQRGGNGQVYLSNRDGSWQINISNNPFPDGEPVWGP